MTILRTASLGANFTGSYKKDVLQANTKLRSQKEPTTTNFKKTTLICSNLTVNTSTSCC